MKYLFICNGNVARSQQAEVFFNALKNSEADVAQSAGVDVVVGKPIAPDVVEVMREIGYEMPGAVRKLVTEDMANNADKIISFKPLDELPEYLQARKIDIEFWNVPDPRHQSIEFHRKVRDDIKDRVTKLVNGSTYQNRINFSGDFDHLINRIADSYNLGNVSGHSVVEVGFEDFNVKISTENGEFLAKIFSKNRTADEIVRNVTNIELAIAGGVNHPELMLSDGHALYHDTDSGLKLVVMRFIAGKTFYDLSATPSSDDLALIAAEAVKINSIDYDPPYLFDSWAIPNMQWMFDKVKDHLTDEGRRLVEGAFDHYERIPLDELPKCYVHGDLIKTNLIKGDDGKIYVIDFSVANTYPRVQELAVMAANLLFDEKSGNTKPLTERVDTVIAAYMNAGGTLTDLEKEHVLNYALPAAAMEYMGSVNERVVGDTSDEIAYWEKLGLNGLREALSIQ